MLKVELHEARLEISKLSQLVDSLKKNEAQALAKNGGIVQRAEELKANTKAQLQRYEEKIEMLDKINADIKNSNSNLSKMVREREQELKA